MILISVVSMGGSNVFVECFCGDAVAEGGSGAVVELVGDGVEVGLAAGDGVPLGRYRRISRLVFLLIPLSQCLRNLTNYITRALLETEGFRPQLHPKL